MQCFHCRMEESAKRKGRWPSTTRVRVLTQSGSRDMKLHKNGMVMNAKLTFKCV